MGITVPTFRKVPSLRIEATRLQAWWLTFISPLLRVFLCSKRGDEVPKVVFVGSIPPIQSAIMLDGMGDGGRIKLDIPRQYVQALIELFAMAGKPIRFTAELDGVEEQEPLDLE